MVKKRPRKEVTLRYKKTQSMIKGGWYAFYAMEGNPVILYGVGGNINRQN